MIDYSQYIATHAWAQDFINAFWYTTPKISRIIIILLLSKYARRELYGIVKHFREAGVYIGDYSLEEVDYHTDKYSWKELLGRY
jgi:hypothetical protein